MEDGFTKRENKAKKGGWRPGAGRKAKPIPLRSQFLSARTTPEVKRKLERRCIREQANASDLIHRALEAYLAND